MLMPGQFIWELSPTFQHRSLSIMIACVPPPSLVYALRGGAPAGRRVFGNHSGAVLALAASRSRRHAGRRAAQREQSSGSSAHFGRIDCVKLPQPMAVVGT